MEITQMKGNRELFEIEARKYEDCDLSKNEDGSYKSDLTHTCFYWWCKSAQREGYKLVPVEVNDEIESAMFSSVARGEMPCDIYKAMIGVAP